MPFVSKAHGNTVPVASPEFFDQPIVQFLCPLACKKSDDLLPAIHEFRAVSPTGVRRVGQSHFFGITRIPTIFRHADLLNSSVASKRRQWRTCGHIFFLLELVGESCICEPASVGCSHPY